MYIQIPTIYMGVLHDVGEVSSNELREGRKEGMKRIEGKAEEEQKVGVDT